MIISKMFVMKSYNFVDVRLIGAAKDIYTVQKVRVKHCIVERF
jgi:hypothetical protein